MFKGIAILMRYRETWKNTFMGVCCCVQPCILENKKFFELKNEGYRDGIKRKETR